MNGTLHRTFREMKWTSGRYAVAALVLLGGALTQPAHADQVAATTLVSPESIFFVDTESTVLSLNAASAGTVTVNVTDFEWPVALQSLSFSAASESQVLASGTQSNPAKDFTVSFKVGSPGAFFAQISAIAGAFPGLAAFPSIGAYSLDVTFTPQITGVPLPPAVWLFLAGLLGIAGVGRVLRSRGFPVPRPLSPTPAC